MGVRVAAAPLVLQLLDFFDRWRNPADVAGAFPAESADLLSTSIQQLVALQLLDVSNGRRPRDADGWESWDPAAGLLHFSTKDVHYRDAAIVDRMLKGRHRREPMPPSTKRYRGAPRIALPAPALAGEFPRVLRERRTWRRFSRRPVALADLATVLGLSCGIQYWVSIDGVRRLPLTTYPSGGAQHPLEVYVVARSIEGLAPGLYHYAAESHALQRVKPRANAKQIARYLPSQEWYAAASALILITSVMGRTQWKYRFARAYKVVIAEAGHLCQNVCLTATWLGLAPFCTMALADSAIEKDLGIDGVSEAILYAAGVGSRPKGVEWAPWPTARRTKRMPGPFAY